MTTDPDVVDEAPPSQSGRIAHLSSESDKLMTAIHEIHDMESEKRTVDISTPHFHELADKILDTSREVFRHAGEEADVDDDIATTNMTIDQVADGDRWRKQAPDRRLSLGCAPSRRSPRRLRPRG